MTNNYELIDSVPENICQQKIFTDLLFLSGCKWGSTLCYHPKKIPDRVLVVSADSKYSTPNTSLGQFYREADKCSGIYLGTKYLHI
jgi:hypothetical protein